jgi:HlyD family secretion protein
MSLDDLIKKSSDSSSAGTPYSKRKRSFAWLLPVGLLLGFLIILGLLFGGRLLPATSVKTAPVITIRAGESLSLRGGGNSLVNDTKPSGKGSLLFQASGWVEPDPYTVFVPTLINGVVDEVHALEGQSIKKGDLVATLVDDEARLDFQSAQQKYTSLEKKIVAHCTGFEVVRAEISAAQRKIEAFETRLDEARDTSSRLSKLSKGTVSQQQVVQARLATERQIAMLAEAKTEIPRLEALFTQLEAEEEAMTANLDELATARERAKLALDRTKITSSMDGIVLQLHAAPGMKRMLDMDSPTSAVIQSISKPVSMFLLTRPPHFPRVRPSSWFPISSPTKHSPAPSLESVARPTFSETPCKLRSRLRSPTNVCVPICSSVQNSSLPEMLNHQAKSRRHRQADWRFTFPKKLSSAKLKSGS